MFFIFLSHVFLFDLAIPVVQTIRNTQVIDPAKFPLSLNSARHSLT
jgi:hypothetical protein